jgi:hypothetical protein
MARHYEYTGEDCKCGHPMYVRVVTIGSRAESRRGPSCWFDECSRHRSWRERVASGSATHALGE